MSEDDKENIGLDLIPGKVCSNIVIKFYDDAIAPRLRARAEVASNIKKAKGDAEVKRINQMHNLALAQELRNYGNLENIVAKANSLVPKDARNESVEVPSEDWIASWLEYAKRVSEEQVQSLWAGILAGKIQNSGSFPLRTLSIVRDMDKDAAEKFITVCHFVTDKSSYWDSISALIHDEMHSIYENQGIHFGLLNEMISLGLLTRSSHSNYADSPNILFSYRGKHAIVQRKYNETRKKYEIKEGSICLTSAGKELFSLIRKTHEVKNLAFWQYLLNKWETDGLQLREISLEEANAIALSQGTGTT